MLNVNWIDSIHHLSRPTTFEIIINYFLIQYRFLFKAQSASFLCKPKDNHIFHIDICTIKHSIRILFQHKIWIIIRNFNIWFNISLARNKTRQFCIFFFFFFKKYKSDQILDGSYMRKKFKLSLIHFFR